MKYKRNSILAVTAVFISLFSICFEVSFAQTSATGALSGTVFDSSGATMAGANIELTSEATGQKSSTISQASGRYLVPLLPPGAYGIVVRKDGFKVSTKSGIRVSLVETTNLDIVMEVGDVTQQVTVNAAPTMVQTDTIALGRVIDQTGVENLPLVTRNYTQIIVLSPGTVAGVTNATELGRGSGGISPTSGTSGIFVNGQRAYDNNFQINGVTVNDNENTNVGSGGVPIPNPDTIDQFKVQTGLYDASFGHDAGANVDVVTKGGSNQFHGTVFEFFRNEALNANDYFRKLADQPRPVLRQNQFGFTLGGPILKDKLLFFTSYQGTRQVNGASNNVNTSCAASLFSPPFTNDRSAAALGALFGGRPGANGGVAVASDGSNINPVALSLLQFKLPNGQFLIPTPQKINGPVIDGSPTVDTQGFSAFSEPCTFNENQFMTNMDYLPSSRSRISGRFFYSNGNETITFPPGVAFPPGNVPGFPGPVVNNDRVFSLAYTYTLNPNLVNVARLGYTRILGLLGATSPFTLSQVGISTGAQNNDLPSIVVNGSINMVASGPEKFAQNDYSFEDSIFYSHGRHSMRFGGGFTRLQLNVSNFVIGANLDFLSWPDFLLGQSAAQNGSSFSNVFSSLDGYGDFNRAGRSWEANAYYQDDIKLTNRLTLNAGLRYALIGLWSDTGGRNASFDPQLANPNPPASGSIQGYVLASNFKGTVPPGVTRADNPFAVSGDGQNTWGPRLGFSWQVLPHTNRVVLRGGFGTYYSRPTGQAYLANVFGAPFSVTRSMTGTSNVAATFANPFPPPPTSFPFFPPYSPTTAISSFGDAQNFRNGIVQQFGLNVQAELAQNFLLEIGYVGTRGTHLMLTRSADQALSASPENPIRGVTTNTLANIPERQPILGFAPDSLGLQQASGASWYNGLNVSLTKRFSSGLQFLASYTYSKTLDDVGANVNTTTSGNGITLGDQNNLRAGYGPTNFSRPNRFVFSGVYYLPSPGDTRSFYGRLLGGWAVAGVITIQSGQPITITDTNSNNVFGISEDRASIVSGCKASQLATPGSVTSKLNDYFNTACFMTPAVIGSDGIGTAFGNSGVGIVRGPDQANTDISIIKRTFIGWPNESVNLEFRAEMFNAFNTPQFSNPDNSFSDSTFGQISTTSVNPRIVQFALKVNF
jgi:hypothetical protein